MKRRALLKVSGIVAGGSLLSFFSSGGTFIKTSKISAPKKIVVAGGHPDDPETGCGGTIAWLTSLGHEVFSLYLTRGEAGIPGIPPEKAASIREEEAKNASKILGASPVFFGQTDGDTFINREAYDQMISLVNELQPDLVFTQWPIDTHPDHRVASLLIYQAWWSGGRSFPLFYYEVLTGNQTQAFSPTDYVDITPFADTKKKAAYMHESQLPADWYHEHEQMSLFRGLEAGVKHAEAFVGHPQNQFFME
jgi:LmbE family N-acetylglucosaminyl deacetylase